MSQPIAYGRRAGRQRKRWVVVALLVAFVAAGWRWRTPIASWTSLRWQVARQHWTTRGCLAFVPAAEQLSFDGRAAAVPVAAAGTYETVPNGGLHLIGWSPAAWSDFAAANGQFDLAERRHFNRTFDSGRETPRVIGAAFVGRLAVDGRERLVGVTVYSCPDGYEPSRVRLRPYVFDAGSWTTPPRAVEPPVTGDRRYWLADAWDLELTRGEPADRIQLFAGQVDPADPSRFTIGGRYDARPFEIVGQLQPDDSVRLRPTFGWATPNAGNSCKVAVRVCGADEDLKDWSPARRVIPLGATDPEDTGWVADVRFTRDGHGIVVVGNADVVAVDLTAGTPRWRRSVDQLGGDVVRGSADGDTVAVNTSANGRFDWRVVSTPAGAVRFTAENNCDLARSSNGRTLLTADGTTVSWWDLASGTVRRQWTSPEPVVDLVPPAGPGGHSLVITDSSSASPAVDVWSFVGQREPTRRSIPVATKIGDWPYHAVSADGRWLCGVRYAEEGGNRLIVVDLQAGRVVRDDRTTVGPDSRMALSPDGRLVAWTDRDTAYTADWAARTLWRTPLPGDGATDASAIAFSPDGRTMAAVWGRAVHLWPSPPAR